MAYDRYDRRGDRDAPSGHWRERSGDDRDRGRYGHHDHDRDRGFFERASDEISSWFSDDDDRGHRQHERPYRTDRDRHRPERAYGSSRDDRDEDRTYRPMGWATSDRDYRDDYGRGAERRGGYRPMAGDYGRHGDYRRDYGRAQRDEDRGRGSAWSRDDYRRTSFAGSSVRSNREDPPYDELRQRHMDELDRDYHDYRRERQSSFEEDFGSWRERREGKRGLLSRIREHMEVVGSDGKHVGTVDRVSGDRIILTKSDPESGGVHHSISCTMIDDVDDDRVTLEMKADRAKERWRDENRERALFEREDQGSAGPGMLNRSFSGTYR